MLKDLCKTLTLSQSQVAHLLYFEAAGICAFVVMAALVVSRQTGTLRDHQGIWYCIKKSYRCTCPFELRTNSFVLLSFYKLRLVLCLQFKHSKHWAPCHARCCYATIEGRLEVFQPGKIDIMCCPGGTVWNPLEPGGLGD